MVAGVHQAPDFAQSWQGRFAETPAFGQGRFTSVARHTNGRMRIQFWAESGPVYILEASMNLVDWQRIGVAVDHGDGRFTFEDANAARFPNRFYRMVSSR